MARTSMEGSPAGSFARERLGGSVEDLREHEQVRAELGRAVEHANQAVSRAESIRVFVVLPRELTRNRTS